MEPDEPHPSADVPQYVVDAVGRQGPERLDEIARWASELAEYRRAQAEAEEAERRNEKEIPDEEKEELEARGLSTDPDDYEDVPGNAYITTKETKPGYHYYYWQWRDGDSWKNAYIGPVNPR